MTVRQILAVLWTRKWIIIAVMLCALLAAGAYLAIRPVPYRSEGTMRMNSVVAAGAASDTVGGVATNFGIQTATSPTVLDVAAAATGDTSDALASSVTATLVDNGNATSKAVITAKGPTAETAQARAQAVMTAYTAYIDSELTRVLGVLQQRSAEAVRAATSLQEQVRADPSNSVATTNLATELSRISSISTQTQAIQTAGPSTSILTAPPTGTPTVPSVLVVLLVALATGLVVGVAAALIRDQFDNRVRDEEDVASHMDPPVLGGIGWDRTVAQMDRPLPVAGNDHTDLSEALRSIRSTLQVLLPPRGVIVVTSVEPGDGKSFVAANLALAWARAGKQVILVGGDLRRPSLAKYFGDAGEGEGLVDILFDTGEDDAVSEADVRSRLKTTTYRRLRILPPGEDPGEPADVLAREATGDVVDLLRSMADVVIIDTPPTLGMADSALLAAHADGAVLIAAARRTDRSRLQEATATLDSNGATVLGVILNRSTRRLPRTYSAYYLRERASSTARFPGRRPAASSVATTESEKPELQAVRGILKRETPAVKPVSARPIHANARRGSGEDVSGSAEESPVTESE